MDARRPWLPGRFEKLDLNLVALSDLACIERDLRVAFSGRTWSRGSRWQLSRDTPIIGVREAWRRASCTPPATD